MSGTETLVPYLNEKKKNGEEPTIIVDSREASSAEKIVKGLIERGVNVKTELLEKGDYILSDQCAVERKTVQDFVYTLTRRYLFEQLFRLRRLPKITYRTRRLHANNLQVQQHPAASNLGCHV